MRVPHYQNIRDELGRMRRQVVELRPGSFRIGNVALFLVATTAAAAR